MLTVVCSVYCLCSVAENLRKSKILSSPICDAHIISFILVFCIRQEINGSLEREKNNMNDLKLHILDGYTIHIYYIVPIHESICFAQKTIGI